MAEPTVEWTPTTDEPAAATTDALELWTPRGNRLGVGLPRVSRCHRPCRAELAPDGPGPQGRGASGGGHHRPVCARRPERVGRPADWIAVGYYLYRRNGPTNRRFADAG